MYLHSDSMPSPEGEKCRVGILETLSNASKAGVQCVQREELSTSITTSSSIHPTRLGDMGRSFRPGLSLQE